MNTRLCKTEDIADPGSRAFEIGEGHQQKSLFVVHKDGQFTAYLNRCPHTGVNLDWQEHQFLNMDNLYIQCSTHDALFEIDSGKCIAGPCVGDALDPVKLMIRDGIISVNLA